MVDLDKFAEELIDMSNSSVKADRDAIARIKHKTGMDLAHLLCEVESFTNGNIQKNGQTTQIKIIDPAQKIKKRTAGAIVGVGISAIIMLAANAEETVKASVIGACTGATLIAAKEEK